MFGLSLESFKEKCKKEIMNIIFETNGLIYIGGGVRSKEKVDTSSNYKIISYNYIPLDIFDTTKQALKITKANIKDYKKLNSHFYSKNYSKTEEEEYKYCYLHKLDNCEFFKESIATNETRAIVIIDITKDVVDAKDLKKRANCKRLKQTIKREVRDLFSSIKRFNPIRGAPFIGGKTKTKKYRTRKRITKSRKRRF
jgi:hypothetical protein